MGICVQDFNSKIILICQETSLLLANVNFEELSEFLKLNVRTVNDLCLAPKALNRSPKDKDLNEKRFKLQGRS